MKTIRYIGLALFIFGMSGFVISRVTHRAELSSFTGDLLPAPKQWQEIGRKVLLDQSWEMQSASGWWVQGTGGDPNGFRIWLEGSFASSEPSVKMVVMDKDNWQKWQNGYPPLELGAALPGKFRLAADPAGYYFGFFPPAAPTDKSIPTSALGVAARLLEAYQASHPAPIRMSAHIELVVEGYCTVAQAEVERRAFAAAKK